jgi:hypothetical protein
MDEKVKIFFAKESLKTLEREVNHFLCRTPGTLISIEYDTILAIDTWGTGVLLTYMPEKKNEKTEGKEEDRESDERVQGGGATQREQDGTQSEQSETGCSDCVVRSKESGC